MFQIIFLAKAIFDSSTNVMTLLPKTLKLFLSIIVLSFHYFVTVILNNIKRAIISILKFVVSLTASIYTIMFGYIPIIGVVLRTMIASAKQYLLNVITFFNQMSNIAISQSDRILHTCNILIDRFSDKIISIFDFLYSYLLRKLN